MPRRPCTTEPCHNLFAALRPYRRESPVPLLVPRSTRAICGGRVQTSFHRICSRRKARPNSPTTPTLPTHHSITHKRQLKCRPGPCNQGRRLHIPNLTRRRHQMSSHIYSKHTCKTTDDHRFRPRFLHNPLLKGTCNAIPQPTTYTLPILILIHRRSSSKDLSGPHRRRNLLSNTSRAHHCPNLNRYLHTLNTTSSLPSMTVVPCWHNTGDRLEQRRRLDLMFPSNQKMRGHDPNPSM